MCPTIVLVPVIFFILLLLVPIDIEGRVILGNRPKVRIAWLFGLIRKDLFEDTGAGKEPIAQEREQLQKEEAQKLPAEMPEKEPESKGQRWSSRDILSIIRTEGLIGNLKRLLVGLARALRVRRLKARLCLGFEDPADTGLAAGILWSIIGYLESHYPLDMKIEPSFCQEALEGEGEGALRIWPALAVLPLLLFLLSRPMLKATWDAIRIISRKK